MHLRHTSLISLITHCKMYLFNINVTFMYLFTYLCLFTSVCNPSHPHFPSVRRIVLPPGMKCAVQIKFDLIYSSALSGDLSSESTNPPRMNELSIDSIAGAFHLCCPVVLCVNVGIEKCLSDSAVVIGV